MSVGSCGGQVLQQQRQYPSASNGFYSHKTLAHPITHLDDRPPHLAAAQPVLAAGGEEGPLRQEHPHNRGEEDHAGQGEEAEEAVHLML